MARNATARSRIEWGTFGLLVLAIGALLGYVIFAEHREIEQREGERLQNQARIIGENLERQLEGVNNALVSVIDDLMQWNGKMMSVAPSRRLDVLVKVMPGVRTMFVANAEGTILNSSRPDVVGMTVGEREDFKALRAHADASTLYVSAPFKTPLGVVVINLIRVIKDPEGEFAGIVGATLDPEYFNVLVRSVLYAPDMRVAVVHGDGSAFVFMPPREGTAGMNLAKPGSFFNRHRDSGQVATLLTGTAAVSSDERLMASRSVNRAGVVPMNKTLVAHVSRSLSAMYVSWRHEALAYLVLYGLACVASGIGLYLIQRRRLMLDRLAAEQEKERQENSERLELALSGADLGLWDAHVPSGRQLFDERWCSMLGYRIGEIEPHYRSWEGLVNPEDMPGVRASMDSALKGETPLYETEHRLRHKDGSWRWILSRGKVVERDSTGAPVRLVGTHMDITERKAAADELRRSIAFSNLLSEAMPLPIFHKDAEGRYTGCNGAFTRFFGKARSEIVGKTIAEVWPQTTAKIYTDKDLELLSDPAGVQIYETTVAHADGTVRNVMFHKARMLDDAGKPTGIVGMMTDITELKQSEARRDQLEAQLRESQKMEALGTLAGGVAHDFNNIIAAIMGNVELARQDVGPGHLALESLEEIRKASRRAKDLVQQILAFGRRQQAARKVIALAPVVEESARLLRTTLPAGVELKVECAPDAPAVLADATQVEQVLLNLGANAWHAIEHQARPGMIGLSLRACDLLAGQAPDAGAAFVSGEVPPGRYACITLQDNGCGMDKGTVARIFEPFFTTKPVDKGTGLGLAVVHGIVQEHGASIEVHSVPGEGSIFRLYFPAAQAADEALRTSPAEAVPVHGQGRHVLFVDDDESIVFLMTRLLERQGYRVSGFIDAREALAAARANPGQFDLAVTDFNMPGMSGLDVARELRAIRPDLPVALASGYITDELRAQALQGARSFETK